MREILILCGVCVSFISGNLLCQIYAYKPTNQQTNNNGNDECPCNRFFRWHSTKWCHRKPILLPYGALVLFCHSISSSPRFAKPHHVRCRLHHSQLLTIHRNCISWFVQIVTILLPWFGQNDSVQDGKRDGSNKIFSRLCLKDSHIVLTLQGDRIQSRSECHNILECTDSGSCSFEDQYEILVHVIRPSAHALPQKIPQLPALQTWGAGRQVDWQKWRTC